MHLTFRSDDQLWAICNSVRLVSLLQWHDVVRRPPPNFMPCDGKPSHLPPTHSTHSCSSGQSWLGPPYTFFFLLIPQGFSRSSLWWVSPFSYGTSDILLQGSMSYLSNTQDFSRWSKEIENAPEILKCLLYWSELHSQTILIALKGKVSFLNAPVKCIFCIFRARQLWWPVRERSGRLSSSSGLKVGPSLQQEKGGWLLLLLKCENNSLPDNMAS